jgi:hypothetical protein
MTDIEIINNDSQVRFYKKLWNEAELVLAKCFSFHIDIENGFITADIKTTFRKALFEFVKACYKNFSEAISEESRRLAFYEKLETIYGTYNTEGCLLAQKTLPYYDNLYAHQKDALNDVFFKQNVLLAYSMGVGKSIISASISRMHSIRRTVIMCPSAVKFNWHDDMVKFGFNQMYMTMLDANKSRMFKSYFDERFVIVNYDIISKFEEYICAKDVGHFILDEVHFCKNTNSSRSKNVRRILDKFPNARKTLLSGSPIKNRVDDVFNYLRMTGHELGLNHKKFLEQFTLRTSGRGGERVTGGKNLDDLHIKLSNFMLRKTKEQCLDLPGKIYLSYKFELDDYKNDYDKIIKEMSEQRSMSSLTGNIHSLNIITSKAKHKGIVELAEDLIDAGEKVVIFGGYKEPMALLQQHFGDRCVKVDGSVDSFTRNEHVKRFIADESCVVFLGNWQAAGVGINLVNSSNFIVQSFPLTPAELHQGIDRLDRIGQTRSVNVHYTFCEDSVDEHIYSILMDKEQDANAVIDPGKEVVLRENTIEILIKKLLKRDDITFDYDFKSHKGQAQEKTFTPIAGAEVGGELQVAPVLSMPTLQEDRFTVIAGPELEFRDTRELAEQGELHSGDGSNQETLREKTSIGEYLGIPDSGRDKGTIQHNQARGGESEIVNQEGLEELILEYHLMLDTTSNRLIILNDQEFDELNQKAEIDVVDYVYSNEKIEDVISHGRHYTQKRTCHFDESYRPNPDKAFVSSAPVQNSFTLPPPPKFV